MKNYELNLKTMGSGKTAEYTAEIKMDSNATISDIARFLDGIKKVYSEAMKATKRGDYMELEIIAAVYSYERWETAKEVTQKSFDRWVFEGGYNEDREGIYLRPDTRYTDECRDLYLTKDIIHDLASI